MADFTAGYARALADVVLETKLDAPEVERQLEDFRTTLAGSEDLRRALLNPAISVEKRVAILDAVNRRMGGSPQVRNFLATLIRHERLSALSEIFDRYRAEMNRRQGITEAEVITARALADHERAELEAQVAEFAGSRISATFREDPALLGGAIVRLGSRVYDGSVRGNLRRMRDRLTAGYPVSTVPVAGQDPTHAADS